MKSDGKPVNLKAPPGASSGPIDDVAALVHAGGAGLTKVQTPYTTAMAVQVPRDLKAVADAVLYEAALAGEDFIYAWTVKSFNKDTQQYEPSLIEGTSIDGAMILLRNWRNAVCEPELVEDMPGHWILKATFIDLENGFTHARLFRQRKAESHGKYDNERAQDIAFQIGQSKAIRNTVVKALPSWLIAKAVETSKLAAAKQYQNVRASIPVAVEYAKSLGVTEEQLQRKVGKKFADWLPTDLVLLKMVFKGIKEGQTSVAAEFSEDAPKQPEASQEAPPAAAEEVSDVEKAVAEATSSGIGEAKTDPPAAAATNQAPAGATVPAGPPTVTEPPKAAQAPPGPPAGPATPASPLDAAVAAQGGQAGLPGVAPSAPKRGKKPPPDREPGQEG